MASGMLRVAVFGAGEGARRAFGLFSGRVEVVAVVDNDPMKHGTLFLDHRVIAPAHLASIEFDCVVVASIRFNEITKQLLDLGIPPERIEQMPPGEHFTYEDRWMNALAVALVSALASAGLTWMILR